MLQTLCSCVKKWLIACGLQAEREARIESEQAQLGDTDKMIEDRAMWALLREEGLSVHDIQVGVDRMMVNLAAAGLFRAQICGFGGACAMAATRYE